MYYVLSLIGIMYTNKKNTSKVRIFRLRGRRQVGVLDWQIFKKISIKKAPLNCLKLPNTHKPISFFQILQGQVLERFQQATRRNSSILFKQDKYKLILKSQSWPILSQKYNKTFCFNFGFQLLYTVGGRGGLEKS